MSRLEEIFKIDDNKQRLAALVDHAKGLKINILKAKKPDGTYSENELAVLIYNTEQSRHSIKSQMLGFLIGGLLVIVGLIAAILLFVRMVSS